jgi:ATP-dependent Clp protease ATP-binding subunit ClpA
MPRRARAGLQDPNRPIGSFISDRQGKTELSVLAESCLTMKEQWQKDTSEYTENIQYQDLLALHQDM